MAIILNSNSIQENSEINHQNNAFTSTDISIFDSYPDHSELTISDGETVEYIPRNYTVGKEIKTEFGSRWIPECADEIKPSLGMEFGSIDEAFNFYSQYEGSKRNGRSDSKQSRNRPTQRTSCEGSKRNGRSDSKQSRNRPTQRTSCEACIRIVFNAEGRYSIYHFEEMHNHFLVHPDFRKHLKSCRSLDYSKQVLLHHLIDEASIGPSVGYRILTKIHGGHEAVGASKTDASKTDCKNWKRKYNSYISEADSQMMVNMLKQKKEFLEDFSFEYFTVNDGELAGLFWADEVSKLNYYAFGDVVSFDATYRTNKYDMVFIPFTEIDNHKKCVTFGAGMLAKEDISSYKWLLNEFKNAFPREPKVVLTDQDPPIKVVVSDVFKTARHRLCMWHIMEKVSVKVSHSILKSGLREWLHVLKKYDANEIKWLNDMYKLRYNWIPAYFQDWEMSGLMRTSSRSVSENHMFQQLMKSSSTLIEFYTHFDTAMQSQRWVQYENDQKSMYTTLDLTFSITDTSVKSCDIDDSIDRDANPNYFDELVQRHSQVTSNSEDKVVTCSCKKFERCGLFCKHIYYVLRLCGVEEIPNEYITKRWTKCVVPRRRISKLNLLPNQKNELKPILLDIFRNVDACVNRYLADPAKLAQFRDTLEELKKKADVDMGSKPPMGSKEFMAAMTGLPQPSSNEVTNPRNIRNKGCGTKRRLKSDREEAILKENNWRNCAYRKSLQQHDIQTCPIRIEAEKLEKEKLEKK
uniref:protein FAR1-RELATED SEQUENCE 5-like n=1 Tax=Erigeron canadensis TaxID=72917 RepID=UPI001CB8C0D2|nr:protein FAR1-RELATED SEQUENCE 5-like [Erigeron canadensis]